MQKQRHWHVACPLAVTLLCVSPRDYFASKWWELCESILLKFRDKTSKNVALACVARLVWCYVFRCPESAVAMTRKFDVIIKDTLPVREESHCPQRYPTGNVYSINSVHWRKTPRLYVQNDFTSVVERRSSYPDLRDSSRLNSCNRKG